MATKSDLIETLQTSLDGYATTMASEIESFRGSYVQAHAADLAILQLGGQELGQRMDQDKLHTINTAAHASYRTAGAILFDGLALQPQIEQAADAIIAGLKISNPEAFV